MLEPLRKLRASLSGQRDGVLPGIQAFPSIDVDQLARELEIDARAEAAGQNNQPSSDSTVLDLVEQEIETATSTRYRKSEEEYRTQLDLYEERIRRAVLLTDQRVAIEAAGSGALADLRALAASHINDLYTAQGGVRDRQRDYDDFRGRNKLARPANTPDRTWQLVRVLVLVLAVLLETALNGYFFARGSDAGLVGGVSQAILLSLLNVGTAVLFARWGLPRLVAPTRAEKLLGLVAATAFALWVPFLNCAIGHYRDLFVVHAGQVPVSEWQEHLFSRPFVMETVDSYILVVVGIILNLVSAWDAYGLDDQFPGYSRVARARLAAIDLYADKRRTGLNELKTLRDEAQEDLRLVDGAIRDVEYEIKLASDGRTRLHGAFRSYRDHLADIHKQLALRYREANVRARATPPPARFGDAVSRPGFLAPATLSPLAKLDMGARQNSGRERLKYYVVEINKVFDELVQQYPAIDELARAGVVEDE